jgi:hypothetical protein
MCDSVPMRWKSIAMNCMIRMIPKLAINNIPIGSSFRCSPVLISPVLFPPVLFP